MPTQASQAREPKLYKIRISPDRVLGPLDMNRIELLVSIGRIRGTEPTSIEPYNSWTPFASFPELSELLLKKLEADAKRNKEGNRQTEAQPATRTMIASERTKTMLQSSHEIQEEPREDDFGMPTLLDIKAPEKKIEEKKRLIQSLQEAVDKETESYKKRNLWIKQLRESLE